MFVVVPTGHAGILTTESADYNIDIVNTAIEDMDFSDVFTQAVEAKQVAQQELLKAQTEQEQKTMEEQAAADRQVITAKADAEVAKIQAEADREVLQIQADAAEYAGQKDAAVNKALAESLNEILLEYYAIKQWDGVMPEYLAGLDDQGILSLIYGLQNQQSADAADADAPQE